MGDYWSLCGRSQNFNVHLTSALRFARQKPGYRWRAPMLAVPHLTLQEGGGRHYFRTHLQPIERGIVVGLDGHIGPASGGSNWWCLARWGISLLNWVIWRQGTPTHYPLYLISEIFV